MLSLIAPAAHGERVLAGDDGAKPPPNVLFVVYDDLNTWIEPLGEYPDVKTPQMNRLASKGVTFTRAYCQSPICAPSRASFLSGMRPSTTGLYALGSRLPSHPVYGTGSHKSIFESFQDAGYTTASIGKIFHDREDHGPGLDLGNGNYNYGPLPRQKMTDREVSGGHRLVDWGVFPERDDQLEDYHRCAGKDSGRTQRPAGRVARPLSHAARSLRASPV